jgi:hypothetical protein
MSILTDEDLITFLQLEILLAEDKTDTVFRQAMLKKYNAMYQWIDGTDIARMETLGFVVPIKARTSKCTKCKNTQKSIDLICNKCYGITLQLHEGGSI